VRRAAHALMAGLIVFLCINGFLDAPGNLVGDQSVWVRVVGILQVVSGAMGLTWLWGLYRGARWTLPVFSVWSLSAVGLGTIASVAWDTFSWPPVLGAAVSLVVVCALISWWVRAVLRRRTRTPV
jgi:hypothetical protein